ncbi:MAG: Txe/YoeB family addiction module toxin, partial [Sulfurimonas sp.]
MVYWKKKNKKLYDKILKLIEETQSSPFKGTG